MIDGVPMTNSSVNSTSLNGGFDFGNGLNAVNPDDYTGGNVLPGNGYCDVLDVILDGPYYIDPDWFNADNDPEYNNGAFSNVIGNGGDFFKREVTVNGVRIMAAGNVGGQTAVPDAFVEKVARMFELLQTQLAQVLTKHIKET